MGIIDQYLRTVISNFACNNYEHGFDRNDGYFQCYLYNNTAAFNRQKGFMWNYTPSITTQSKNNLAYGNAVPYEGADITGSFNSWNFGLKATYSFSLITPSYLS